MIRLPTSVHPVKEITRGIGWRTEGITDDAAGADYTLSTPAGTPPPHNLRKQVPSGYRGVRCRLDHHRVSHGHRRGDRAAACRRNGKFHGLIMPTTPAGCR